MKYSVNEVLKLLRRLHGINPKAKTLFKVTLESNQIEFKPTGVKEGKEPNSYIVDGEDNAALIQLIDLLKYQSNSDVKVEMVTTNRLQSGEERGRKAITLPAATRIWPTISWENWLGAVRSVLPFFCPEDVVWRINVHFDGKAQHYDHVLISNSEMCRLLSNQPKVAFSIISLKQGDLTVSLQPETI